MKICADQTTRIRVEFFVVGINHRVMVAAANLLINIFRTQLWSAAYPNENQLKRARNEPRIL